MSYSNIFINLDSLVELSNKLNSSHNNEFILNTVLLSLMGKLGYRRGLGLVINANNNQIETKIIKGSYNDDLSPELLNEAMEINAELRNKFLLSNGNDNLQVEKINSEVLGSENDRIIFKYTAEDLLIYISFAKEKYAFLKLDSRVKKSLFNSEEKHYLTIVSNLTANALEITESYDKLYKTNLELQRQNQLLSTIFEISKDFSFFLSIDEIKKQIAFRILGQLLVNKFAVYYKHNDIIEELILNLNNKLPDSLIDRLFSLDEVSFSESLAPEMSEILISNNITLIAPMKYHNKTLGLILLGNKYNNLPFLENDLNFIEALGYTVVMSIENVRLIQEEISKKQIEKELELALEIQQNLLPKAFPKVDRFDIYGLSRPSKIVSGDYFDVIQKVKPTIYFVIADVSGKGVPASLLMANVQSALRSLTNLNLSINEIVNQINSTIYNNTTADKFITFFIGKLNSDTLEFEYINAGHNPPVLYRPLDEKIIFLHEGGFFLGFLDSPLEYEIGKLRLSKGDIILMYTDGIVECQDPQGNEFGLQRVLEFIKRNYEKSAEFFVNSLLSEVIEHCQSQDLKDDISMIAFKVK
jgi:sigma-B regulation protein RsbU (phosphoserine phosphatase)